MPAVRITRLFVSLVIILAALALSTSAVTTPPAPGPVVTVAAAPVADSGPIAVVGEAGSANFYASPETYPEPAVALIDAANVIKQAASFASDKAQILGAFDTAMFPLPAKYGVNLPIKPAGTPSIEAAYPGQPVLIRQVRPEVEQTIDVRSPRIEYG